MNRALGFGIAAAGGLPLLVTGATPAGAHGDQHLTSAEGSVSIVTAVGDPTWHAAILVHDKSASDNVSIMGRYNTVNGTKGGVSPAPGGLAQSPTWPKHNQITAMRKCQKIGSGDWQCGDWTGV